MKTAGIEPRSKATLEGKDVRRKPMKGMLGRTRLILQSQQDLRQLLLYLKFRGPETSRYEGLMVGLSHNVTRSAASMRASFAS
jgi:hypothetical protein